jgi:hypothetical protein
MWLPCLFGIPIFRFFRQPNKPITPRPVAKSGIGFIDILWLIFSGLDMAYRDRPAPCNATGSRSGYAIPERAGNNRSVGVARGTRGTRGVGLARGALAAVAAGNIRRVAAEDTQN